MRCVYVYSDRERGGKQCSINGRERGCGMALISHVQYSLAQSQTQQILAISEGAIDVTLLTEARYPTLLAHIERRRKPQLCMLPPEECHAAIRHHACAALYSSALFVVCCSAISYCKYMRAFASVCVCVFARAHWRT